MIKANVYFKSYDQFLKNTYGNDLYRLRGELKIEDEDSSLILKDIPIIWTLSELEKKTKLSLENPSVEYIVSDDETYTINLCSIDDEIIISSEEGGLEVKLNSFDLLQSVRKECIDIYFSFFQKSEKRNEVVKVLFGYSDYML